MKYIDRMVLCLQKGVCPLTGKRNPVVFEYVPEEKLRAFSEPEAQEDEWAIYSTISPVMFFLTFGLNDVEYEKKGGINWDNIVQYGFELSQILAEDGESTLPQYLKILSTDALFWVLDILHNQEEKVKFIVNGPKTIKLSTGMTYGEAFAKIQKEKISYQFGKQGLRLFYKYGPLVAYHILLFLDAVPMEKIREMKGKADHVRNIHDFYRLCDSIGVQRPTYRMSSGVFKKFLHGVINES